MAIKSGASGSIGRESIVELGMERRGGEEERVRRHRGGCCEGGCCEGGWRWRMAMAMVADGIERQ